MMTTRPGYVWDATASEWVEIGQAAIVSPFKYQATAPSSPSTGDIWIESDVDVPSIDSAQFLRWRETAVGGETSLSGNDDNSLPLQYTPGYEQLYINGVLQVRGQDYTATTGTTVTGLIALTAGDTVEIFSAVARNVADVYTQTQSDNRFFNSSFQSGFRNVVINGDCRIDQRNSAAVAVVGNGYSVDRWFVEETSDAVLSTQQSTDVPAGQGFVNSVRTTSTTANASTGTTEFSVLSYFIEGRDSARFAWGTASAKTITASFWVKASVAGTYSFTLYNSNQSRINPIGYTINASNTWEKKTITISGETSGTWETGIGRGVIVNFYTSLGSSYVGSSGWNNSGIFGVTGQANAWSSIGNTFAVTGLQIEEGSIATPFEYRPIGTELTLCQRYFYNHTPGSTTNRAIAVGIWFTATQFHAPIKFPVSMRVKPTLVMPSGTSYYISYQNSTNTGISTLILEDIVTTTEQAEIYNSGLTSSTIGPALFRTNNALANVAFSAEL